MLGKEEKARRASLFVRSEWNARRRGVESGIRRYRKRIERTAHILSNIRHITFSIDHCALIRYLIVRATDPNFSC